MLTNEERRPGRGGARVSSGSGTQTKYPTDFATAIDECRVAMQRAGVGAPSQFIADGRIHRFEGDDDKPGRRNGWYVLHLDGHRPAGAFGSWKTGASATWVATGAGRLTPAEHAALRRHIAKARRQRNAKRAATQRSSAAAAWREWSAAEPPDPSHPYLTKKGVGPHGLRQRGHLLLVPLADVDGRLWSLQRIGPEGRKRFVKDGRVTGLFCLVGDDPETAPAVIIAEGWATAATVHEATGLPVLAAMNAGNLEPVAKVARRQWPDVPLVIAADNDDGTEGNPGITKAKAAALATGAHVVAPPALTDATDFNDLGVIPTRRLLAAQQVPMQEGRSNG